MAIAIQAMANQLAMVTTITTNRNGIASALAWHGLVWLGVKSTDRLQASFGADGGEVSGRDLLRPVHVIFQINLLHSPPPPL